jgi:hypothetical protein
MKPLPYIHEQDKGARRKTTVTFWEQEDTQHGPQSGSRAAGSSHKAGMPPRIRQLRPGGHSGGVGGPAVENRDYRQPTCWS